MFSRIQSINVEIVVKSCMLSNIKSLVRKKKNKTGKHVVGSCWDWALWKLFTFWRRKRNLLNFVYMNLYRYIGVYICLIHIFIYFLVLCCLFWPLPKKKKTCFNLICRSQRLQWWDHFRGIEEVNSYNLPKWKITL